MSGSSSERYTRKEKKSVTGGEKSTWLGFVDIELTDDQRAFVSEMNFADESALSFMEEVTSDGYKVSVTADRTHKSYIATITGQHPDCINQGYSLSGRGPNVVGALASLAFKHCQLCDRGLWSNFSNSTTKPSYG